MKVKVCNMLQQELEFEVSPNDTILTLKTAFCEKEGLEVNSIAFHLGPNELLNNQTFNEINIKEGDIIYQSIGLIG